MQNWIKSRKYFFIHQKILTLNICDGAKQIYPKKKDSMERYSTNFSSSRPEVYNKKGVLKKIRHQFIDMSLK